MTILLLEDNEGIIKGLTYALEANQDTLVAVSTILEANTYLASHTPDFALLDVMIPDGDGFSLYEKVIAPKKIPTIFLTALDSEENVIKGLTLGAEDYMIKPFSTKELLVRMDKILGRVGKRERVTIKDITYDFDTMEVFKQGKKLFLTPLELKLFHYLMVNRTKVVLRTSVLDKIWEWTGNDVDDHTVTVYINRLREKLGTDIILTIKKVGYRIHEAR